jgi:hypothetical protein
MAQFEWNRICHVIGVLLFIWATAKICDNNKTNAFRKWGRESLLPRKKDIGSLGVMPQPNQEI